MCSYVRLVLTQKSTSFRPIFGGDTRLYTVRRLGGVCSCPARLRNSYGLVAFLYVVGGNGCQIISTISRQNMRQVSQICVVQRGKAAVSLDIQEVTKHVLLFVTRAHFWLPAT